MRNKSVVQPGETLKWCSGCQTEKELTEFHKNRSRPDGLQNYCKVCAMAAQKSSESKSPRARARKRREAEIQRKYGMAAEEFETMLWDQNGRCPVCTNDMDVDVRVDRDLVTGEVRALLCDTCLRGVVSFRESTDLLFRAISYLDSYKAQRPPRVSTDATDETV